MKPLLSIPYFPHFLALSSDGRRLVLFLDDRIEIWAVAEGKLITTIARRLGRPNDNLGNHGDLSPDGSLLVTTRAKDLMVFDANTGKLLIRKDNWKHARALTRSPIFSEEGKTLVVGSDSEVITVWRINQSSK